MLSRFRPALRRALAPIGVGAFIIILVVTFLGCASFVAVAHEGDADGPAAAAQNAWPRVAVQSELYEIVGVLKGDRLTIYLDDFASNEPVAGATVTVTVGNADPITAEPVDGGYVVSSPRLGEGGALGLVFSISAASGDERLMGTLQVPDKGSSATIGSPTAMSPWPGWLVLVSSQQPLLLSLVSFILGLLAAQFMRSGRLLPATVTAATAGGAFVLLIVAAVGHNGQGVAASAPTVTVEGEMSDAPRRLPDGDVWVAKPTQRLLDVRTVIARQETTQRAVNLIGRVIVDPNRTGLVQSIGGGRVIAPAGGLPHIGQAVAKGHVLAEIERALPQADRTTISDKLGEIEQLLAVTEAKLKRLRQLAERGVALQSLVTESELELEGLRRRREVIRETRVEAEVLRAPTDGIIAVAKVVPGQVVQAQDILFQIVDPNGFRIEALVYGDLAPASLTDAEFAADGQPVRLTYQGHSRTLQQHATVVHFAIPEPPPNLNVGQPVTVVAKTGVATAEIVVPRDAIVRSGNGGTIVWQHHEPENFEGRPVRTQPLDATRVIISAGVKEGERLLIRGANLVNQIR